MDIVEVDINLLKPSEYNPRAMTAQEAKDLEESLTKFDLVEPIVVNSSPERLNIIIGGHQRYNILKKLGKATVPVVYVPLNLEQEQELNIRLNKNLGHFEWDLLANFDEELLKKSGFQEMEIANVFEKVPTDAEWLEALEQKGKETGFAQMTFVLPVTDMEYVKAVLESTNEPKKEAALMLVVKDYDSKTS